MLRARLELNLFARILWHLIRWCSRPSYRADWDLIFVSHDWHHHVSGFLGRYLYSIFGPIAKLIKSKNILISINNISQSTGHLYLEVDYLARMHDLGIISKDKKIYCIFPKSPTSIAFQNINKDENIRFIISGLLNLLIYPLVLRYSFLACNAGLSGENHGIDSRKNYRLGYAECYKNYIKYFKIVAESKDYFPVKKFHQIKAKTDLNAFLNFDKYIVLQIKDVIGNATYKPVDPETYLPVIEWSIHRGFGVVFAGRETMPTIFARYGVVNYAQSKLASSINDYHLINNASAVLSSGSGFSCIPFALGTPMVIVNVWNFLWASHSNTIIIPSLLSYKENKLSFIDQYSYVLQRDQLTRDCGPEIDYSCEDASGGDILDAWKELFDRVDNPDFNPTDLQRKFKSNLIGTPARYSLGDISNSFMNKHADRL